MADRRWIKKIVAKNLNPLGTQTLLFEDESENYLAVYAAVILQHPKYIQQLLSRSISRNHSFSEIVKLLSLLLLQAAALAAILQCAR